MRKRALIFGIICLLTVTAVLAQPRDRASIPDKYKWNLADLYATDVVWRAEKDKLEAGLPTLAAYQGTLGGSPAKMLEALDAIFGAQKDLYKLYVYAAMSADTDTRDAAKEGMRQEMTGLYSKYAATVAWMQPEVLALGKAKVDEMLKAEPKLELYRMVLDDIVRRAAHTGTPGEEKIIADASLATAGAGSIRNVFANAEFPYPTIKLADGSEVTIDAAAFTAHRASANRADREKVFSSFFGALGKYRGTYGAMINAKVQNDIFDMRARKYDSTLEAALDSFNIPTSVYQALLDGVNANTATLQRYLTLRKKMMGVDELHYYDLYAPLVGDVDAKYPIDLARKNITSSLKPLGDDYVAVINESLDKRWIDLYPSAGKRSGAYSESAYDTHPYMLLNYNDNWEDMTTLTHELGHTMQSYYSNKTQPYVKANYPIFVAEVASTFNEALLVDYMLKTTKDKSVRLAILGNYLEGLRLTVFRQTQFAEFELRIHEMAEKGQPLTGETLDKVYLDIVRKYYGHDKGVCVVEDYVASEWSYIPHFFYNYYVYQYATSFTASAALSEKVMAGDKVATKKYRDFLAAGGSKYPIELLRDAGVDMTSAEPLTLTMKKMNRVIDEMEKILAEKK
ncbi:MAG: oligoendopeptidase F [Thermoanaerobaculia bacterium]|nr:oligoendopeptidase F [Thermoanaerobaculia bacterium]